MAVLNDDAWLFDANALGLLPFADRWSPVAGAIGSGAFDPVGNNNSAQFGAPALAYAQQPVRMASAGPMPNMPQPQMQPPTGPPPSSYGPTPSMGDAMGGAASGIGDFLSRNLNALMGLGAGIAGGRNWGQGISQGVQLAMQGQQADRQQREVAQQRRTLMQVLQSKGFSAEEIAAAAANPALAAKLLARAFPEQKFEKLGPGDTLVGVTPGMGGRLGSVSTIASGGPEKAPAGYQWNVQGDPSKGMSAIPGGPATKIPPEVAGRVALMDQSLKDFQLVRKELERSWGPGDRAMAALGAGDIGRAQRVVRVGIEATLRAMTGAAAPESEVKRYEDMFMPGQTDGTAHARQKLDLLENFMRDARRGITNDAGTAPTAPSSSGYKVLRVR